jgi:hypothetical protein
MIEDYNFGKIVVDGMTYRDDIKIVQGRVVSDWWRRSGHTVHLEDISDILATVPDVLVIGKGNPGYMQVAPDLKEHLRQSGIRLIEEKTAQAVKTFNRMCREGRHAAAGFHLTC